MKVLILTNEDHIGFVSRTIFPYNGYHDAPHDIHAYHENKPYPFEGITYDIGVSFMYQYKVPAKEVNSHTWFNFHPGPLPEYKGRNLCYHAIMNGAEEFGVTVHFMDEGFDTGDIIEVLKFPISELDTAGTLSEKAVYYSKRLFERYFPMILQGYNFSRFPNVGGNYYPKNPIDDYLFLSDQDELKKQIRAITYGNFYPKLDVNGITYKIVRDE